MSVEVKLELGHHATLREKRTVEGFTHDWTVFVKGGEGSNIYHFVEKVVFHLHESFPKPKRVVKEPPYQVSESGYAGFTMPIEVYFRSKEEPKKVCFEYDLFLRLEGSPVHNLRLEKLTFQNPSEEFRRKLLKARTDKVTVTGAVHSSTQSQIITQTQNTEEQCLPNYTKSVSIAEKKPRSNTVSKESVKPSSQLHSDTTSVSEKSRSPDPAKVEDIYPDTLNPSKKIPHQLMSSPNHETKTISRECPADDSKESKVKMPKLDKIQKSGVKRSLFAEGQNNHCSSEKKKKHGSSTKVHDNSESLKNKEKKNKHKSKSAASESKKEKHKVVGLSQTKKKSPKTNSSSSTPSPECLTHEAISPRKDKKVLGTSLSLSDNTPDSPDAVYQKLPEINDVELNLSMSSDDEGPAGYTSKENSIVHDTSMYSVEKSKKKITSQNSPKLKPVAGTQHNRKNSTESSASDKRSKPNDHQLFNKELVALQRRIMSLNDQKLLQRIVDIIEKTGKFHITTNSFDFDLCSLDYNTVRKLQNYLSM